MFAWLLVPLGVVITIYGDKIFQATGEIDFAEKYMPSGGTPAFIKLFGLVLTFGALTWIFGGKHIFGPVLDRLSI